MTKHLLEPVDLGRGRISSNRVLLAPLTNRQSHSDGTLGDDELAWLERRARGGFGLIESCATHVSAEGQGFANQLGIWDDRHLDGWRRISDAIHNHGALATAQIFDAGLRAPRALTGRAARSASPGGEGDGAWDGMSHDDIRKTIDSFVAAALRAQQAGLDGVEIHGAHGYLLTQFISTDTNHRQDEWGGPLENRARLIRTIARSVRQAVGANFVVGARLTPENYGAWKGLDLDETVQIARWLVEDGVDNLHISLWDGRPNSAKYPDRHTLEVFSDALGSSIPLIAAGGVWSRDDAQRLLDLGAHAVALGRAAIVNPDWPLTVATDGREPTRPPLTVPELNDRAVSTGFAEYLRAWKGFVAD